MRDAAASRQTEPHTTEPDESLRPRGPDPDHATSHDRGAGALPSTPKNVAGWGSAPDTAPEPDEVSLPSRNTAGSGPALHTAASPNSVSLPSSNAAGSSAVGDTAASPPSSESAGPVSFAESTSPVPSSDALLKPIHELRYLTIDQADTRRPYYRVIMRFLFEQSEIHRGWIGPEEIRAHVSRVLGVRRYADDDCEGDMQYLRQNGNVLAEPRSTEGRILTVEEFQRGRLVYQISPISMQFERLLVTLEQSQGEGSSLDATLLDRLWGRLNALRALIDGRPDEPDREYLFTQVYAVWDDAFIAYTRLRESTAAFHHALTTMKPEDLSDTDAFLAYKDVLTENLRVFINDLMIYAGQVRELFRSWRAAGTPEILVRDLVTAELRFTASATPPDPVEVETRFWRQYRALEEWFRPGGGVDVLRRATSDNLELILSHLARILSRHRVRESRQRELERLALAFGACPTLDEAHRLASLALGWANPRHIHEQHLYENGRGERSVWATEPFVVEIQVRQSGRRSRGHTAPVEDVTTAQQTVLLDEARRTAQLARVWDQLFQDGILDFAGLTITDRAVWRDLFKVLSGCLTSTRRTAIAPDGRTVRLEYPGRDWPPVHVQGPDGIMATPRYRLVRRGEVG